MSGAEDMDRMIERVRKLGQLRARTAELARAKLEAVVRATAAAGTTPDGERWKPTKEGGRALANAAAALSVRVVGSVLQVVLTGHHVFHSRGAGRTLPQRKIIPANGDPIPDRYLDAVRAAAVEAFRQAVAS